MHPTVLVRVVDQVGGKETVSHGVRESVGHAFGRQAFKGVDASLDEMVKWPPSVKPLGSISIIELSAGKALTHRAVSLNIGPLQLRHSSRDVCRFNRYLDILRGVDIFLRNEAFEDFQVGHVERLGFAVWL